MRLILSAITLAAEVKLWRNIAGRAEFCGRERHILKYRAGVILLGRYAFLVGNAVLGGADKILCGTNDANDREDAERDGEISSRAVNESAVDLCGDRLGNVIAAATAATAAVVSLAHLGRENDGVYYLNDRRGHVLRRAYRLGDSAVVREIRTALEHAYVALSAKENYALFKNCNSLEFLASSAAKTRLKGDLDVELDADGVKAAVELDRIDGNIGPGDTGILCPDVRGMLNDIVSEVGKQNLHVLEAVAVAAGIEDAICLDANRFALGNVLIRNTARKSVFLHR